MNQSIASHYLKEGLYEDIVSRLKEQNIALDNVKRTDIAGVDEFHVRGAAVSRELSKMIDLKRLEVLDVGCGLGGPCRMLADEFDCNATGIDLSNEYIRTAKKLSKLLNLDDKTAFVVGDATDLPFENNAFDVVWTQHVQMNVPDKKRFYSEIKRVLKTEGVFLYYDIFKNNGNSVEYPMPWASSPDQSFLFKSWEMNILLNELRFEQLTTTNQTELGIKFFETLVAQMNELGGPKIGLNVLMGESTKPKLLNLLGHLKNKSLMLESGAYKKK